MQKKSQLILTLLLVGHTLLWGQLKGRLVIECIDAPSLANSVLGEPTKQPLAIYLPPSYDSDALKRFPVVYYLPGYEDTISAYLKGYINGYRLKESMDSIIAQKKVREMIVVIVNGYNMLEGSFYANSPVTGNWEDFVTRDAIEYIDKTYRTLACGPSRAIVGLSMGGYGALQLSMKHPSLFSVAVGECPGLANETGMLETVLFEDKATINRIISIRGDLAKYTQAEAHQRYLDTITYFKKQGDWITLFSFAYGSAFAPNTALKAPYFDYPFSSNSVDRLVVDSAIFRKYESGFGNLKAKIILYRDSLLKLRGYAIDYGINDCFKWIPEGCIYYDQLLTEAKIPHQTWQNEGNHGSLHKSRFEDFELLYCDSLLIFRE